MKVHFALPFTIVLVLATELVAYTQHDKATMVPVADLLPEDGTLDPSGKAGSINLEGWQMAMLESGALEFTMSGAVAAPEDESWDTDFQWRGVNAWVIALAFDGRRNLYAGGQFTIAGDVPANYVAKWNGTSWRALGTGPNNGADYHIDALTLDRSGNLYAGGWFFTARGRAANYVAKWNGSKWSSLGTGEANGVNERVLALALDGNGGVYAGGWFTTAGGAPANHVGQMGRIELERAGPI
jgi:hypothetical protein